MKVFRKRFYIIVPLLATTLTLLFIEAGLSIFYPIPYSMERDMFYIPDEFTGYKIRPHINIEYYQNGILTTTNGHGHRDDEVSIAPSPNKLRILAIGDSFTVGANVSQEKAFPQQLETLLNEKDSVEVINTGVGGWSPFQYAQYYQHYGRSFNPDLIMVGFYVGNDTYDQLNKVEQLPTAIMGRRVSRSNSLKLAIELKVLLYENSHIARLIMNGKKPTTVDFTRDNCEDFTKQYINIQKSNIYNYLKENRKISSQNSINQILRIKELAKNDSTPMLVVLIPDENQVNKNLQNLILSENELINFDFNMPQSLLKRQFEENNIPVLDLLPAFLANKQCLYMNDTHWNNEGHKLAASLIYEKFTNEKQYKKFFN